MRQRKSTMLEKHRLAAMVLGTLLCSIVPAATYAQDKLERFQEQPRIIDGRLLAAVTATLKTTPATGVAVGEVARANLAGHTGIEVQLLSGSRRADRPHGSRSNSELATR
jgi:hypothetical protein